MATSSEPVRQHWVPKVYLRAFCASPVGNEQIHVCNLQTGERFLTSIDNVAVKRHFYTLDRDTDSPSYIVETTLAKIESLAKPILTQIEHEKVLPDAEGRQTLASFFGTLHMRSREGLQTIHEYRQDVADNPDLYSKTTPAQKADLAKLSDEEMREFFARSAVVVGERIGVRFLNLVWRLIRAEEDYFFTSENPVYCFHLSEQRWGPDTPGARTLVPISPTLLLHMSPEPVLDGEGTMSAPADAVHGINGMTLLGAEQFLYADRSFDNVNDLLLERAVGLPKAFGSLRR